MSFRPADVQPFSLREVVATETASHPLYLTSADAPKPILPTARPGKSELKFDLQQLQHLRQRPTPSGGGFDAAVASATATFNGASPLPMSIAPRTLAQMRNPFEPSAVTKQDIVRLTAISEDLEQRLKKASERASAAEAQLTKTHNALVAERQLKATRSKEACAELSNARAIEQQLRSELESALSVSKNDQMQQDKFQEAVANALKADAANEASKSEVASLRTSLDEKELRVSVMSEELLDMNTKYESALAAHAAAMEEVQAAHVAAVEEVQAAHATAVEEVQAAQEERDEAVEAARLLREGYATMQAQAQAQEQAQAAEAEAAAAAAAYKAKYDAPLARADDEPRNGGNMPPCCKVMGVRPEKRHGSRHPTAFGLASKCPLGGAYILETVDVGGVAIGAVVVNADAVNMTAETSESEENGTGENGAAPNEPESTDSHDATSDMVNAVIKDLTAFFKDVQQHENLKQQQEDLLTLSTKN